MNGKQDELIKVSHNLQSVKATERKKALERLSVLMQNREICEFITKSTLEKSRRTVTWDSLFESISEAMFGEAENLFKESKSERSFELKKQKLRQVFGVLKNIITNANKITPIINLKKLLSVIIKVLGNEEYLPHLGNEFLGILCREVLSCRKYVCQLQQYTDITDLLMSLFSNKNDSLNNNVLSKTFLWLLKALYHHCDPSSFLQIFPLILNKCNALKSEKNPTVIENVIKCVKVFVDWMSVPFREKTCKLSEDIFEVLISMWKNRHLSTDGISCVMEVLISVIELHHPKGHVAKENGGLICYLKTWHLKLKSLMQIVNKQLSDVSEKTNYSNKINTPSLNKDRCYYLAALIQQVLYQIASLNLVQQSDVAFTSETVMFVTNDMPSFKCYSELNSALKSGMSFEKLINSLKTNEVMLDNFPGFVKWEILVELVKTSCKILNDNISKDVTECCISMLYYLLNNLKLHLNKVKNIENVVPWDQVWISVKSFLHQSTQLSTNIPLKLLTVLIDCENLSITGNPLLRKETVKEIFPLIYANIAPTNESITFVIQYISTYGLSEYKSKQHPIYQTCCSLFEKQHHRIYRKQYGNCEAFKSSFVKYPHRVLLIDWLLQYMEESVTFILEPSGGKFMTQRKISEECETVTIVKSNLNLKSSKGEPNLALVVKLLCLLCSKEIIKNTLMNPCSMENDLFRKCFDPEFVSVWKCFNFESKKLETLNEEKICPSCNVNVLAIEIHALDILMNLLESDANNFIGQHALDQVVQSVSNYLYICGIAIMLYSTVTQFQNLKGEIVQRLKYMVKEHVRKVKHLIMEYFNLVQYNVWSDLSLIHDTEVVIIGIQNMIQALVGSDLIDMLNEFRPCADVVVQNIQEKFLLQNSSLTFRKYSYESGHSTSPEECSFLEDDCMLSSTLVEDDLNVSAFPATGRKRKSYSTQYAPESKRMLLASNKSDSSSIDIKLSEKESAISLIEYVTQVCCLLEETSIAQALDLFTTEEYDVENLNHVFLFESFLKNISNSSPSINFIFMIKILDILKTVFKCHYQDYGLCSNLLHYFSLVLRKAMADNSKCNAETIQNIIDLVEVFWKIILKRPTIPILRISFVEAVTEVLNISLISNIAEIKDKVPLQYANVILSNPTHMCYVITRFLSDKNTHVVLYTASIMARFFDYNNSTNNMQIQEIFCKLLNKIDVFNLQLLTTVGSCLQYCDHPLQSKVCIFLSKIISKVSSTDAQNKESIEYCLTNEEVSINCIEFIRNKHNESQTSLACKRISIIKENLFGVLKEWAKENMSNENPFNNFPIFITGCKNTEQFYLIFQEYIFVSVLLNFNSTDRLFKFIRKVLFSRGCGDVKKVTEKLFTKYFATILTALLQDKINFSKKLLDLQNLGKEIIGKPNIIQSLLSSNFVSVFKQVITTFDQSSSVKTTLTEHLSHMLKILDPKSNFSIQIFGKLISNNFMDQIPEILFHLKENIVLSKSVLFLKKILESFHLVTEITLFQGKIEKSFGTFVAYNILYTVMHVVNTVMSKLNFLETSLAVQEDIVQCCYIALSTLEFLFTKLISNDFSAFMSDRKCCCVVISILANILNCKELNNLSKDTVKVAQNLLSKFTNFSNDHPYKKLVCTISNTMTVNENNCVNAIEVSFDVIISCWQYIKELGKFSHKFMENLLKNLIAAEIVYRNNFKTKLNSELISKVTNCLCNMKITSDSTKLLLGSLLGQLSLHNSFNEKNDILEQRVDFKINILMKVGSLIFNSDIKTSKISLITLKALLKITDQPAWSTLCIQYPNFSTCMQFIRNAQDFNIDILDRSQEFNSDRFFKDTEFTCRHINHDEWTCAIASNLISLCSDEFLLNSRQLCEIHGPFSSYIFPWIIKDVLVSNIKYRDILSSSISKFCKTVISEDCSNFVPNKKSIYLIIETVLFLRKQEMPKFVLNHINPQKATFGTSNWELNFWLDISYLLLAQVALFCGLHYEALIFVDIWQTVTEFQLENSMYHKSKKQFKASSSGRTCRALGFSENIPEFEESGSQKIKEDFLKQRYLGSKRPIDLLKLMPTFGNSAKDVLIKAGSSLADIDLLQGVSLGDYTNRDSQASLLEIEGKWIDAIQSYDKIALNDVVGGSKIEAKILNALYSSGLDHIGSIYGDTVNTSDFDDKVAELQWKSSWSLSKWEDRPYSEAHGFNSMYHSCLSSLNEKDTEFCSKKIMLCRLYVIDCVLKECNFQAPLSQTVQSNLCKLISLNDVENINSMLSQQINKPEVSKLISGWVCYPILSKSFENINDAINSRTCLLNILIKYTTEDDSIHKTINDALFNHLRSCLRIALDFEKLPIAYKQLHKLKSCNNNLNDIDQLVISYEESKLIWYNDNKSKALTLAEDLCFKVNETIIKKEKQNQSKFVLADMLLQTGIWLIDSQSSSSENVFENFLKKSVKLADQLHQNISSQFNSQVNKKDVDTLRIKGYRILGNFADKEYRQVVAYMKSFEFEQKCSLFKKAENEIRQARNMNKEDSRRYLLFLQKNYQIDRHEFESILDKRQQYLLCALEHYVKCLSVSDENDLLMYRICTLWFDNIQNQSIPGFISCAWPTISSHKYIPLAYQLAARLNSESSEEVIFQETLKKILVEISTQHPHHVLPVIMALANAHKDYDFAVSSKKSSKNKKKIEDSRVVAASEVLEAAQKKCPKLVSHYQTLFEAYMEIAYLDTSPWAGKSTMTAIDIPKNLTLSQLCNKSSNICRQLSDIIIPTATILVDRTAQYNSYNLVTFSHFKPYFKLCGGINVPKVFVAVGTDGKEKKHLVKGRDDLRQDAVMQQVFEVVNLLLLKNSASSLKIRTYKVVPLSQRSGLVEWCEGTMPIGSYLLGVPKQTVGAHQLYRPTDISSSECRSLLSKASGEPAIKKSEIFKRICEKFKPVMRFFFFNHFLSPSDWYEKHMAYTKSVGTSSIVGYILGLGDRHVQNILIDCQTAELVHIDFGVAFEQGKCLPTPETVPFRLTRDIVDGFGITGVEGLFRNTCEKTLKVLRSSSDTITTIVEVLLHDPLHDWVLTPGKAMNIQRQQNTVTDTMQSTHNTSVLTASTVSELLNDINNKTSSVDKKSSLAGRALMRVQEKLQGVESGSVLSVAGQVSLLIQHATDVNRLCMLFAGWQPYV